MSQFHVAVLMDSLRRDSFNRKLAHAITQLAPPDVSFQQLNIADLPPFSGDDDAHQAEAVQRLKSDIRDAHGLLFVTPEYNRCVPGVLINAIDHASRPYGQSAWSGKPAGVLGVSMQALGTTLAQQHLRNILAYLNCPTLVQSEPFIGAKDDLFNNKDEIAAASQEFLQDWMDQYVAWVKKHAAEPHMRWSQHHEPSDARLQ